MKNTYNIKITFQDLVDYRHYLTDNQLTFVKDPKKASLNYYMKLKLLGDRLYENGLIVISDLSKLQIITKQKDFFKGFDLSYTNLSNLNFMDRDLSEVNFTGANLDNSTFSHCTFKNANFGARILEIEQFDEFCDLTDICYVPNQTDLVLKIKVSEREFSNYLESRTDRRIAAQGSLAEYLRTISTNIIMEGVKVVADFSTATFHINTDKFNIDNADFSDSDFSNMTFICGTQVYNQVCNNIKFLNCVFKNTVIENLTFDACDFRGSELDKIQIRGDVNIIYSKLSLSEMEIPPSLFTKAKYFMNHLAERISLLEDEINEDALPPNSNPLFDLGVLPKGLKLQDNIYDPCYHFLRMDEVLPYIKISREELMQFIRHNTSDNVHVDLQTYLKAQLQDKFARDFIPDLSGLDLRGLNLRGLNFGVCNLSYIKANEKTNLNSCNMRGSSLFAATIEGKSDTFLLESCSKRWRVEYIKANNADFSDTDMRYSKISNIDLSDATFSNVLGYKMKLSWAKMNKTLFNSSNFEEASFNDSNITDTTIRNTNFGLVKFWCMRIQNVTIEDSSFNLASFEQTNFALVNCIRSSMINTKFADSSSVSAAFIQSNMDGLRLDESVTNFNITCPGSNVNGVVADARNSNMTKNSIINTERALSSMTEARITNMNLARNIRESRGPAAPSNNNNNNYSYYYPSNSNSIVGSIGDLCLNYLIRFVGAGICGLAGATIGALAGFFGASTFLSVIAGIIDVGFRAAFGSAPVFIYALPYMKVADIGFGVFNAVVAVIGGAYGGYLGAAYGWNTAPDVYYGTTNKQNQNNNNQVNNAPVMDIAQGNHCAKVVQERVQRVPYVLGAA